MVSRYLSVFLKVGLFSISFFALVACGSSSSSLPGAQPVDTPPEVTSATLSASAKDASPGVITVVFSENVNGIGDNTFLVRRVGAAAGLIGVVAYDSASRTATFTNTSDKLMLFNTNYTVTLKGIDILDDSDKPLESKGDPTDYIFTFNTGDAPIVDISASLVGDVKQHFIAVDDNGRAASVWKQQDSSNVRIYASLFENGKWQDATTLVDIPILTSANVGLMGLVSNGSGFAVQWNRKDQAGATNNNHVSIYTDADGWTGQDTPINIGAENASDLILATNGNEYVTVWTQPGKILSRFNSANTWSVITDIASFTALSPSFQLTSNGSGYGLVWLNENSNGDDVVNFDLYINGSWYNQIMGTPTRVSLPDTDPNGMKFESNGPHISSKGIYYALNWYGQDVLDESKIFSAVMTGFDTTMGTGNITWNGPTRISVNGNPSINNIVSNGTGYLSTWDAVDVNGVAESFVYSNILTSTLSAWETAPGLPPIAEQELGPANGPLPFGTRSGYAMVWSVGTGGTDDDVYGRVKLNSDSTWQSNTKLSNSGLGKKSGLTINGSSDKFIAAWTQEVDMPGLTSGYPMAYVNRYNGTAWEASPTELELDSATASSYVKTVPLGNGHYMATWLKEVTLGGVKRLDSKFVQAP